jgi:COX assembly mitochondrial protein 2
MEYLKTDNPANNQRNSRNGVTAQPSFLLAEHRAAMHPPLGAHLHPMCADAALALKECHRNNPVMKFTGCCNSVRAALDVCLQEEFEALAKVRAADAKVKMAARKQRAGEMREGGGMLSDGSLRRRAQEQGWSSFCVFLRCFLFSFLPPSPCVSEKKARIQGLPAIFYGFLY